MAEPLIRVTLDVTAQSEVVVTQFALTHLRERGYDIAPPNEKWETLAELIARLGLCYETYYRAISKDGCPTFATHRTVTGRLRELCSNAHFDDYLRRYKKLCGSLET